VRLRASVSDLGGCKKEEGMSVSDSILFVFLFACFLFALVWNYNKLVEKGFWVKRGEIWGNGDDDEEDW